MALVEAEFDSKDKISTAWQFSKWHLEIGIALSLRFTKTLTEDNISHSVLLWLYN